MIATKSNRIMVTLGTSVLLQEELLVTPSMVLSNWFTGTTFQHCFTHWITRPCNRTSMRLNLLKRERPLEMKMTFVSHNTFGYTLTIGWEVKEPHHIMLDFDYHYSQVPVCLVKRDEASVIRSSGCGVRVGVSSLPHSFCYRLLGIQLITLSLSHIRSTSAFNGCLMIFILKI